MKEALSLTYPPHLIKEPVIHRMSQQFEVVFNLRRAKITDKIGEIVLELEGSEQALKEAEQWLKEQGLKVQSVTKDTIES